MTVNSPISKAAHCDSLLNTEFNGINVFGGAGNLEVFLNEDLSTQVDGPNYHRC